MVAMNGRKQLEMEKLLHMSREKPNNFFFNQGVVEIPSLEMLLLVTF
jgi:hypothetical protein